jgi:hypothetical protein
MRPLHHTKLLVLHMHYLIAKLSTASLSCQPAPSQTRPIASVTDVWNHNHILSNLIVTGTTAAGKLAYTDRAYVSGMFVRHPENVDITCDYGSDTCNRFRSHSTPAMVDSLQGLNATVGGLFMNFFYEEMWTLCPYGDVATSNGQED